MDGHESTDDLLKTLLEAPHPYLWEEAIENPESYVALRRDQYNQLVELAAYGYCNQKVKQAAIGDRASYPCRHPTCTTEPFTNQSNRRRHERRFHPEMFPKESGHES